MSFISFYKSFMINAIDLLTDYYLVNALRSFFCSDLDLIYTILSAGLSYNPTIKVKLQLIFYFDAYTIATFRVYYYILCYP